MDKIKIADVYNLTPNTEFISDNFRLDVSTWAEFAELTRVAAIASNNLTEALSFIAGKYVKMDELHPNELVAIFYLFGMIMGEYRMNDLLHEEGPEAFAKIQGFTLRKTKDFFDIRGIPYTKELQETLDSIAKKGGNNFNPLQKSDFDIPQP